MKVKVRVNVIVNRPASEARTKRVRDVCIQHARTVTLSPSLSLTTYKYLSGVIACGIVRFSESGKEHPRANALRTPLAPLALRAKQKVGTMRYTGHGCEREMVGENDRDAKTKLKVKLKQEFVTTRT